MYGLPLWPYGCSSGFMSTSALSNRVYQQFGAVDGRLQFVEQRPAPLSEAPPKCSFFNRTVFSLKQAYANAACKSTHALPSLCLYPIVV